MVRAARRRKLERWLVTSMVLVAIVAGLMLMVRVGMFDKVIAKTEEPAAAGRPVIPDRLAVDSGRPFDKTPASGWADGAEGIVVPPAMQIGEFTREQVAAATTLVRDALVASRLEPQLLVEHDPTRYLSLLAPDARKQLAPLFGTGNEPQAQALVSLVSKGSPLLAVQPKVTGRMWAEAGGPGELVVHTNYLFAYAFEGPASSDPMDSVVVVRAEVDYVLRSGGRWTAGSQGLWYGGVGGYGYSISCSEYKKGFLAPAFRDGDKIHRVPRRDRDTYFDPAAPLPAESGCPS